MITLKFMIFFFFFGSSFLCSSYFHDKRIFQYTQQLLVSYCWFPVLNGRQVTIFTEMSVFQPAKVSESVSVLFGRTAISEDRHHG